MRTLSSLLFFYAVGIPDFSSFLNRAHLFIDDMIMSTKRHDHTYP